MKFELASSSIYQPRLPDRTIKSIAEKEPLCLTAILDLWPELT